MVNVRHNLLEPVLVLNVVKEKVARVYGALGSSALLVLRKSGTEPLIRVMIEAREMGIASELANSLAEVIKEN